MNEQKNSELSRRDFLRATGSGLTTAAIGYQLKGSPGLLGTWTPATDEAWGVLIDTTRCVGCDSCVLACRQANELPDCDVRPEHLDCYNLSYVHNCEVQTASGEELTVHIKQQCMHCLHPACVSACTVGALRKTPEGPVVYDEKRCIGCRYCQYACPFGVPTYEWTSPIGLIHKCQMCMGRFEEGGEPVCIAACPTGALRFGKRTALLAQAHAQIASNPGRYVDHIYGEFEAGGTSVLYLSSVPFCQLGFPELGSEPIPRYAETVMKGTPVIAASVAALASVLYWVTKRRESKAEQSLEVVVGEEERA